MASSGIAIVNQTTEVRSALQRASPHSAAFSLPEQNGLPMMVLDALKSGQRNTTFVTKHLIFNGDLPEIVNGGFANRIQCRNYIPNCCTIRAPMIWIRFEARMAKSHYQRHRLYVILMNPVRCDILELR
jgi:hypothetical protein